MKKIIKFLFPEKSKWIDIEMYETSGYYHLIQMRHTIKTNKKSFRTVKIGFVNDNHQQGKIYKAVLVN